MRTKNNYSYNRSFKNAYEKKKNQKVQSETHLQGLGCFVRKGFVLGVECLFNCFPQYHTDQQLLLYSELKHPHWFKCAVTGEGQGTEGCCRCNLERGSVVAQSVSLQSPVLHIPESNPKEFQNHSLLQHWQLLPSPSCLRWKLWDKTSKNRKRLCLEWSWETSCYI